MSQSLEGKGVWSMDLCSGRRLIEEMAVNSHSQLVSLDQTADAEPVTRVGPPGMRVPRARGTQALTLTSAEDLSPKRNNL